MSNYTHHASFNRDKYRDSASHYDNVGGYDAHRDQGKLPLDSQSNHKSRNEQRQAHQQSVQLLGDASINS